MRGARGYGAYLWRFPYRFCASGDCQKVNCPKGKRGHPGVRRFAARNDGDFRRLVLLLGTGNYRYLVGGVVLRAANPESNDCRGNHTLIQVPPALQWKAQNGIWHIRFFEAEKCVSGRENIPDS